MSIYVYLCLSMSIYVYLCLSMSIYVYLCLSMSIYVYLCLSMSIYVYLCLSMSIYVYLCLSMSIYLSIYLFIYLSIYPSILYLEPTTQKYTVVSACMSPQNCNFQLFWVPGKYMFTWAHIATESMYGTNALYAFLAGCQPTSQPKQGFASGNETWHGTSAFYKRYINEFPMKRTFKRTILARFPSHV